MIDLDAYLERVGLRGRPGLAEIQDAHARSVPFENLDPRRGVPVSLDPADLQRKLVDERRGGFCFEQNLLLAEALTALGMGVEPMLARVRMGRPPGLIASQTHVALRVDDGNAEWLVDVGFGLGTPLGPLPLHPGGDEREYDGWRFRIVAEDGLRVVQALRHRGWTDMYVFSPVPVPRIDCELSSWYASTSPAHAMVTRLLVAVNGPDGSRVALSDFTGELLLSEQTPDSRIDTPVPREAIGELLETRFGLDRSLA